VICSIQDIRIGNNCLIAEYVSIRDQNHGIELSKGNFDSQPLTSAPVKIADNVWIGAKVSVLAGVRIGANSVVAANAVLTHDVAEATVVGGVPARIIRGLNS
jgi:acetyltransferase-like isoleucine patch superfamily enzyme